MAGVAVALAVEARRGNTAVCCSPRSPSGKSCSCRHSCTAKRSPCRFAITLPFRALSGCFSPSGSIASSGARRGSLVRVRGGAACAVVALGIPFVENARTAGPCAEWRNSTTRSRPARTQGGVPRSGLARHAPRVRGAGTTRRSSSKRSSGAVVPARRPLLDRAYIEKSIAEESRAQCFVFYLIDSGPRGCGAPTLESLFFGLSSRR